MIWKATHLSLEHVKAGSASVNKSHEQPAELGERKEFCRTEGQEEHSVV